MTPMLRKSLLATHITVSVGWIGAAMAYLVLVVAALTRPDTQTLRAAWWAMELIGWSLIVPLAFASLLTGAVISLGTPWGLFRHYWVLVSFTLTIIATVVLLQHMPTVSVFAGQAANARGLDSVGLRSGLRAELLHAGLGVLVLLVVEALNVFKPWGATAYGRRRASHPVAVRRVVDADRPANLPPRAPRWARVVGVHAVVLAIVLVIAHLAGGGLPQH